MSDIRGADFRLSRMLTRDEFSAAVVGHVASAHVMDLLLYHDAAMREASERTNVELRNASARAVAAEERAERAEKAILSFGSPFDKRGADRLADEVAALIRLRVISERSPVADALLDYREPPSTPRADRLAEVEAERDALREQLREARAIFDRCAERADTLEHERDEARLRTCAHALHNEKALRDRLDYSEPIASHARALAEALDRLHCVECSTYDNVTGKCGGCRAADTLDAYRASVQP